MNEGDLVEALDARIVCLRETLAHCGSKILGGHECLDTASQPATKFVRVEFEAGEAEAIGGVVSGIHDATNVGRLSWYNFCKSDDWHRS